MKPSQTVDLYGGCMGKLVVLDERHKMAVEFFVEMKFISFFLEHLYL